MSGGRKGHRAILIRIFPRQHNIAGRTWLYPNFTQSVNQCTAGKY